MESLTSGTLAGTGSFRCEDCGYVVTLAATETIGPCASCGGRNFARASLFAAGRFPRRTEPTSDERAQFLAAARELRPGDGDYLAYRDGDAICLVAMEREWTRIGRSLGADVRFDDATVSRRHALVERGPEGLRVLDDRSLNGVFVNGERVKSRPLADGDEIEIGRHRIVALMSAGTVPETPPSPLQAAGS